MAVRGDPLGGPCTRSASRAARSPSLSESDVRTEARASASSACTRAWSCGSSTRRRSRASRSRAGPGAVAQVVRDARQEASTAVRTAWSPSATASPRICVAVSTRRRLSLPVSMRMLAQCTSSSRLTVGADLLAVPLQEVQPPRCSPTSTSGRCAPPSTARASRSPSTGAYDRRVRSRRTSSRTYAVTRPSSTVSSAARGRRRARCRPGGPCRVRQRVRGPPHDLAVGQLRRDGLGRQEVVGRRTRPSRGRQLVLLARHQRRVGHRHAQRVAEQRGDGEPVGEPAHRGRLRRRAQEADPGAVRQREAHDEQRAARASSAVARRFIACRVTPAT